MRSAALLMRWIQQCGRPIVTLGEKLGGALAVGVTAWRPEAGVRQPTDGRLARLPPRGSLERIDETSLRMSR